MAFSSYWNTLCFKVSFSDAWARVWIKHELVAMCCIYSLYHENPLAIYPIHSVTVFKLWQYNTLCVDSCGRVRLWHRSSRVLRRCLAAWNFDKHLVNSDCCWGFVVYAQIGGKYSHLAHILASLTLCLALPCMKWTCLVLIYMCMFFIFFVRQLCGTIDKLICFFFYSTKVTTNWHVHDYFFFVINYHIYSYAPSLLHAVIEAKASRSSFWCLSSPVNNRRTAIIQNTIYKQRMYRDNDKMQLAGKQLNCVHCPNACYCFSCQQINIAQLACLALSLWTTLNIERHIYHVQ